MRPTSNAIKVMEGNTKGRDIIIGDVHGSEAFRDVMASLGPDDRLFCVGDLADRGTISLEVIQTAMQDDRVHVTFGNHEQLLLRYIQKRRELQQRKEPWRYCLETCDLKRSGGDWALDTDSATLALIEHYLVNLPIIIKLPNAFIVHSDLPLSKAEINKKIANNDYMLTDGQIEHAIWARKHKQDCPHQYRDLSKDEEDNTPVYYGHDIVARSTSRNIDPVRPGCRYNLDYGACRSGLLVSVEHSPVKKIVVYGKRSENAPVNFDTKLAELEKALNVKAVFIETATTTRHAAPHTFNATEFIQQANKEPGIDFTHCCFALIFTSVKEIDDFIALSSTRPSMLRDGLLDFTHCRFALTFTSSAEISNFITLANANPSMLRNDKIDFSHCVFKMNDFSNLDLSQCIFKTVRSQAAFSNDTDFSKLILPFNFTAPNNSKQGANTIKKRIEEDGKEMLPDQVDVVIHQTCSKHFSSPQKPIPAQQKQNLRYTIASSVLNFSSCFSFNETKDIATPAANFTKAISDFAVQQTTVDCIQIPIKHKNRFLTLTIFKKDDDTIGAYLIGSSSSRLTELQQKAQELLIEHKDDFQKLLGMKKKALIVSVDTIHIPNKSDSKSGLRAMGTQFAITKRVQQCGCGFLKEKSDVQSLVTHEHKLVRRMSVKTYLKYRMEKQCIKGDKTRLDTFLKKFSTNPDTAVEAVKNALTEYLEKSRKGADFWRRAFTDGQVYAQKALALLNDSRKTPEQTKQIAYQIAEEILMMRYKGNKITRGNRNSRLHFLIEKLNSMPNTPTQTLALTP